MMYNVHSIYSVAKNIHYNKYFVERMLLGEG